MKMKHGENASSVADGGLHGFVMMLRIQSCNQVGIKFSWGDYEPLRLVEGRVPPQLHGNDTRRSSENVGCG